MRKTRRWAVIGVMLLVLGLMGCSKKDSTSMDNSMNTADSTTKSSTAPQMTGEMEEGFSDTAMEPAAGAAPVQEIANTSQKLIKRVNFNLETLEYDTLLSFLNNKINELNGYVQESNSSGRSIYDNNLRSAYMVVRIPSNRLDEFVQLVGENTTIVSRSESTEDATMAYVDNESRKKALEIQQERLFALLEKVEKVEDIVALETRISEVTYELENYTSSLRTYDNLVQYGTVTIQINEVERASKPEPKNVWERMSNGFSDSMYNIKEGFKDFAVWFVISLPYLIIWGIVVAIIVIVVKKKVKKNSNINSNRYEVKPEDKDKTNI